MQVSRDVAGHCRDAPAGLSQVIWLNYCRRGLRPGLGVRGRPESREGHSYFKCSKPKADFVFIRTPLYLMSDILLLCLYI